MRRLQAVAKFIRRERAIVVETWLLNNTMRPIYMAICDFYLEVQRKWSILSLTDRVLFLAPFPSDITYTQIFVQR